MAQQTIDIGAAPGNQGDGDSLRDAFEKTQANFDDVYNALPITDTSLEHDNPAVDGSIAKALADAAAAGGGTVDIGPGVFICASSTLVVADNVRLRGAGRRATTIEITGRQVGINMSGVASSVEALHVKMPDISSNDGILINRGEQHLRDIFCSGGSAESWAININAVNIAYLSNIRMGGSGNALTGNGIIIQNTTNTSFNFGDSKLSKIDITLFNDDTNGIKIVAPDIVNRRLNNILLSQINIIGTGASGGCIGVYLHNASRIVFISVDLEQLDTGVLEEGVVGNCRNNVFLGTFALGVNKGYNAIGNVVNRTFIGCQNLLPESTEEGDAIVPSAIWINEVGARLWEKFGVLQMDDGSIENGIQIRVNRTTPSIQPSSNASTAQLTLGRTGTRGVECEPGIILPLQQNEIADPKEGMLVQYSADVVGTNAGLYQLRRGNWVFIN